MNKRYLKVLGLYSLSTFVPALISEGFSKQLFKSFFLYTTLGYGIFAAGLKVMKQQKRG
ncbi:hypothetical protein [Staphylococcus massiliensis]|uniref:Uncharacterized protein n=1 Tax=Staphylococcus massiliensis S46 TaxID=1229783 RepID=K9AHP5_9STAP|nr:hypothetical protein [Staphylococcus massiliensis]EKU46799.1 hypothetical protein C273_08846 [Staphylococcus massiliensis S46]MCG3399286.1 hypothetical protein [Staphylococcus massiliensis]MCG3402357.1 hypothetical protein [Staphylococcus massiliensis]MCG3411676.1 hypothetical protein [Staphylococcus massiliensis]